MRRLIILMATLLVLGCAKKSEPTVPVVEVASKPGFLVTIIDIRKTEECEDQTLMERDDKLRLIRCGYFGKLGDQFYFHE